MPSPARPRRNALAASAAHVRLDAKGDPRTLNRTKQPWQQIALQYRRTVGELAYCCDFIGNAMSKLGVVPSELPPQMGQEPIATTNQHAIDIAYQLDQGAGFPVLLKEAAILLTIVGECYLVGSPGIDQNGVPIELDPKAVNYSAIAKWDVRSINELVAKSGGGYVIKDSPTDTGRPINDTNAYVIRIWLKDPEWSLLADSPVRAVLEHCEALVYLEKMKRAQAKSRIWAGKILKVPDELTFGPTDPTESTDDGQERDDPFMSALLDAIVTPIQDEGSAGAAAPFLVRGPGEHLKNMELLDFGRPFDPQVDVAIERALRRFAQGVPVPVEVVLGMSDVNHWSAWMIDDATWKSHLEPLAISIFEAFTDGYYRPALRAAGIQNAEQFLYWFDPAKLVSDPNRGKAGDEAMDRDAISWEAYRRVKGFGDEDAPTVEELRMRQSLRLRVTGPEFKPSPGGVDTQVTGPPQFAPAPASTTPPGGPGTTASANGNGTVPLLRGRSGKGRLGRKLADIDRMLRIRIAAAADAAVRRALEAAGARLRTKARTKNERDALRDVPDEMVASILGPSLVAQIGDVGASTLDRAFAPFLKQYDGWVKAAQSEALALVPGLSGERKAALAAKQTADRDASAAWLRDQLVAITKEDLYGQSILKNAAGEIDPSAKVPQGLLRAALARAGGTDESELEIGSGYSVMASDGSAVGGVAFGDTIEGALAEDYGAVIEGYEWDYGPFPREPFPPHEALDGETFINFDDPVLENASGWPEVPYFLPGDHPGCVCDLSPVILGPDGEAL